MALRFAALVACAAACTGERTPATHGGAVAPARVVRRGPELEAPTADALDELYVLASGAAAPKGFGTRERARILAGEGGLDGTIDRLLAGAAFARVVGPQLLLQDLASTPAGDLLDLIAPLSSTTAGGQTTYHLRKPCREADVVMVRPWWDPSHEVRICSDSYRPDYSSFEYPKGMTSYCGSTAGIHAKCGCGKNLAYCARDEAHLEEMSEAFRNEVVDTIAHVVSQDLPLDEIYRSRSTVRSWAVEFFYRRSALLMGRDTSVADAATWNPKAFSPRPEYVEGTHAGLLTTPHIKYFNDVELRPRLKRYFRMLWCKEPSGALVTADAIVGLGLHDTRHGEGWQRLAALPVCTNCHARLDYGGQFFLGDGAGRTTGVFVAKLSKSGSGPLYGDSIDDPRGTASLTAQGFAGLALDQPEFGACVAQNVTRYVFGSRAPPDALDDVKQTVGSAKTLKAAMHAALRRRALSSQTALAGRDPAPDGSAASERALRGFLDDHCDGCHSSGPHAFLATAELSRETWIEILGQVAFGAMPKGGGLDPEVRGRFVRGVVEHVWTDPPARAQAMTFYEDVYRKVPAHRFTTGLALASGGAAGNDIASVPEGSIGSDLSTYTTGYAATMALAALRSCRDKKKDAKEFERCVSDAIAPRRYLRLK